MGAQEQELEPIDALERALIIAIQIRDENSTKNVVALHKSAIEDLRKNQDYRWILDLSRSLSSNHKKVSHMLDLADLIPALEESVQFYVNDGKDHFKLSQLFLDEIRQIYSLNKEADQVTRTRIRIAESLVEEGDWKRTRLPSGNSIAAHFYEEAAQAYIDLGGHGERVNELKVKISEFNKAAEADYKRIESSAKIDRKPIDDYVSSYKGLPAEDFIKRLAVALEILPSIDRETENAKTNFKAFIGKQLFAHNVMKGGIKIKELVTDEEKVRHDTIAGFCNRLGINISLFLSPVFSLFETEHPDYQDTIQNHLAASGLIREERRKIIRHGIRAYGQREYLAASHILVFQVEGVLRDTLGKLGQPTFSMRNGEMRERDLNDILTTFSELKCFPPDLLATLQFGLADISGLNLRNEIAHGILPEKMFSQGMAQLLLFILLTLSTFSITPKKA